MAEFYEAGSALDPPVSGRRGERNPGRLQQMEVL